MTWTYAGDPSATDRDRIRFLVGDTVATDPQLTDEEIAAVLDEEGGVLPAAIALVEALLAKFARLTNQSHDGTSYSYSQRQGQYEALLAKLRRKQGQQLIGPVATGISRARKLQVEQDTDRIPPPATRGEFDRPGGSAETESDDE